MAAFAAGRTCFDIDQVSPSDRGQAAKPIQSALVSNDVGLILRGDFRRGADFVCVVNLADHPVPLPEHAAVLLACGPTPGGALPPDTAVWLRTP